MNVRDIYSCVLLVVCSICALSSSELQSIGVNTYTAIEEASITKTANTNLEQAAETGPYPTRQRRDVSNSDRSSTSWMRRFRIRQAARDRTNTRHNNRRQTTITNPSGYGNSNHRNTYGAAPGGRDRSTTTSRSSGRERSALQKRINDMMEELNRQIESLNRISRGNTRGSASRSGFPAIGTSGRNRVNGGGSPRETGHSATDPTYTRPTARRTPHSGVETRSGDNERSGPSTPRGSASSVPRGLATGSRSKRPGTQIRNNGSSTSPRGSIHRTSSIGATGGRRYSGSESEQPSPRNNRVTTPSYTTKVQTDERTNMYTPANGNPTSGHARMLSTPRPTPTRANNTRTRLYEILRRRLRTRTTLAAQYARVTTTEMTTAVPDTTPLFRTTPTTPVRVTDPTTRVTLGWLERLRIKYGLITSTSAPRYDSGRRRRLRTTTMAATSTVNTPDVTTQPLGSSSTSNPTTVIERTRSTPTSTVSMPTTAMPTVTTVGMTTSHNKTTTSIPPTTMTFVSPTDESTTLQHVTTTYGHTTTSSYATTKPVSRNFAKWLKKLRAEIRAKLNNRASTTASRMTTTRIEATTSAWQDDVTTVQPTTTTAAATAAATTTTRYTSPLTTKQDPGTTTMDLPTYQNTVRQTTLDATTIANTPTGNSNTDDEHITVPRRFNHTNNSPTTTRRITRITTNRTIKPRDWTRRHQTRTTRRYVARTTTVAPTTPSVERNISNISIRKEKMPPKELLTIELLVVVDYALYSRYYNKSSATLVSNKSSEAILKLRHHVVHMVNSIDKTYASLKLDRYNFNVKLVGIYVATDPSQSPWTESIRNKSSMSVSSRDMVNTFKALDNFHRWANKPGVRRTLPKHDHAMLLTGYNIYEHDVDGSINIDVLGMGFRQGMCRPASQSIVEDRGTSASSNTAAHELAHTLDVPHDGDMNDCSPLDQFLMTPIKQSGSYGNRNTFSKCSVQSVADYISRLNRYGQNCLLNKADNFIDVTEWETHLSKQPGQQNSPDDQCKQVYGPKSYYCGGLRQDKQICDRMFCYNPAMKGCYRPGSLKGAEGTTCGNHKWCQSGKCVYDTKAPSAADTCPHGDTPGRIFTNSNDTCAQTSNCYSRFFANRCCGSCGKLKAASTVPGCEYGDRHTACKPAHCASPQNWKICCQTCVSHFQRQGLSASRISFRG